MPITPGEIYRYNIDMWATSNVFKVGSSYSVVHFEQQFSALQSQPEHRRTDSRIHAHGESESEDLSRRQASIRAGVAGDPALGGSRGARTRACRVATHGDAWQEYRFKRQPTNPATLEPDRSALLSTLAENKRPMPRSS